MHSDYLFEKLGPIIQAALRDDQVTEIIVNPDGKIWLMRHSQGAVESGVMNSESAWAFVNALAQSCQQFLNDKKSYLDACLPFHGERINVTIPPIVDSVSFNIRKRAHQIYTLQDYVDQKILTSHQAQLLKQAIRQRKNILVSGGPGSGKTTFTNALLEAMSQVVPRGHRVLLLEQVAELQCRVENCKRLLTSEHVDMRGLLWIAMRNSPDRLVMGEVRDGAALEMLKAWNTGCPGGIATIHANSAEGALQRVVDLSLEATHQAPYSLMGEALDLIVQLTLDAHSPSGRRVSGILQIERFDRITQQFLMESV